MTDPRGTWVDGRALVLVIELLSKRWHGEADWPPSPFRALQALVAAAARGDDIVAEDEDALRWLERRGKPFVAAPPARRGQEIRLYVPNNDLDAVGGDPTRIAEIRGGEKRIRPWLLDGPRRFLFVWPLSPEDEVPQDRLSAIAARLHCFGRGIDMAFARFELAEGQAFEHMFDGLLVYVPCEEGRAPLRVPLPGSIESLRRRHQEMRQRFGEGGTFRKPPMPRFGRAGYDCPPRRLGFELRQTLDDREPRDPPPFARWPLTGAATLVERLRDGMVGHLARIYKAGEVERLVIGRGAGPADKARRLRIVPLPSIGHEHVVPAIRRLIVELPQDAPFDVRDVETAMALASIDEIDHETGEVLSVIRPVAADVSGMAGHYGIDLAGGGKLSAHRWRTVTPVALPVRRSVGRLKGAERLAAEEEAVASVMLALRHADVPASAVNVLVQREPFDRRGAKAGEFAHGRFDAARLWHVEIEFDRLVAGPLVIGDGRFVGLGLLRPAGVREVAVWEVHGMRRVPRGAEVMEFLRHVRRALLAVSGAQSKDGRAPRIIAGHEEDGTPARSGSHEHVFLVFLPPDGDADRPRVAMIAPWLGDCSREWSEKEVLDCSRAMVRTAEAFQELQAGSFGRLRVRLQAGEGLPDVLVGPATAWRTRDYRPTRHMKARDRAEGIRQDVVRECVRRGLPEPAQVQVGCVSEGARPRAEIVVKFATPVHGPILLGRGAHLGEGVFLIVNCA